MPDDKSKTDFSDRNRVAGDEIAKHGNDRETLEREAKQLGSR